MAKRFYFEDNREEDKVVNKVVNEEVNKEKITQEEELPTSNEDKSGLDSTFLESNGQDETSVEDENDAEYMGAGNMGLGPLDDNHLILLMLIILMKSPQPNKMLIAILGLLLMD